jgi:hypothetical protein
LRLHFGLGKRDHADTVTIRWPNGKRETLENVAADRLIFVEEAKGIVKATEFGNA